MDLSRFIAIRKEKALKQETLARMLIRRHMLIQKKNPE